MGEAAANRPIVLNHVIDQVEVLVERTARLEHFPSHPVDVQATWADIDKAQVMLDWHPEVSFEQGVRCLGEWHRENQSWASEIQT